MMDIRWEELEIQKAGRFNEHDHVDLSQSGWLPRDTAFRHARHERMYLCIYVHTH